jgi:uncharacterized membrane protein YdcZ (DUF606 family)
MERGLSIYRVMGSLLVLDVVLFGLSGIPAIKHAEHGWKLVVGDICWFGFLAGALAVLVLAVTALVRSALGRRPTAA